MLIKKNFHQFFYKNKILRVLWCGKDEDVVDKGKDINYTVNMFENYHSSV